MNKLAVFKDRVIYVTKDMIDVYIKKHIARSAAALSYHLTITVFPLLICVSAILANLHIKESGLFMLLEDVIPEAALLIIDEFLFYVSGNRSTLMLVFGVFVMLTSTSAAFRTITSSMGEIQGKTRYSGIWGTVFSFVVSIIFLVSIYASALVIISGEWLLQFLEVRFGFGDILSMWNWLRFVLLFLILFVIIFGIYIMSAPKETKKTHRLPGALGAAVVLVAVSMVYSRMITESIKYALLYGSLASIIVMMVWLYTCGIIVIMGNVFNVSLRKMTDNLKG